MSSAEAQIQRQRGNDFVEPMEAQECFSQQFDLSQPEKAMSAYQQIMHQHTKQQFEMASESERRRSKNGSLGAVSLSSEASTGSVSSTAS